MAINWDTVNAAATAFVTNDNDKAGRQLAERITLAQTAWRALSPAWDEASAARSVKAQATPLKVSDFIAFCQAEAKKAGTRWTNANDIAISAIVVMRFHTPERRATFTKWCADDARRNENIETYRTWLPQAERGDWTVGGKESNARKARIAKSTTRRETRLATVVEVDTDVSFATVVVGGKWKAGLTKLALLKHNLEREMAIARSHLSETEADEAIAEAMSQIRKAVSAK